MTYQLKANDNKTITGHDDIVLPLPPLEKTDDGNIEIYARFMKHMRLVPNSRMEIKILSAIQFTSDMLDMNDAIVSKSLADMGLRAPRKALPKSYLDHVDASLMRSGFDVGGPCPSAIEMKNHWDKIGEDRFAAFNRDFDILTEPVHI